MYAAEGVARGTDGYWMAAEHMADDTEIGHLYDCLVWKAMTGRFLARLIGQGRTLRPIADLLKDKCISGQHSVGLRMVPIARIIGSEGRCNDFDRRFRPIQTETCGRWYSLARARLRGIALPPVVLIQIGDAYYVRDGHHRISVARAFGDKAIEAMVTAYELSPRAAQRAPAAAGG